MSLVLTVFFGLGIMLLGWCSACPAETRAGLTSSSSGRPRRSCPATCRLIAVVAALLCLMVLVLYKEFKLLAFDPDFGAVSGLSDGRTGSAAQPLHRRGGGDRAGGGGRGAHGRAADHPGGGGAVLDQPAVGHGAAGRGFSAPLSGVVGTLASQMGPRMPTGPLIVLAASLFFFLSLLAAPHRGLLARLVRFLRTRAQTRRSRLLEGLTTWPRRRRARRRWRRPRRRRCLAAPGCRWEPCGATWPGFPGEGLVDRVPAPAGLAGADAWKLTAAGVAEAYPLVREERLHLVCRMHEADLDGVQWDAGGRLVAAPETLRQLEALLVQHGMQPRLHPGDGA